MPKALAGLGNLQPPGLCSLLTASQLGMLADLVESGPDPTRHGIELWRRVDLRDELQRQFGIALHDRSVGKLLVELGYRWLSVRSRHPKADEAAQEALKKLRRDDRATPPRARHRKADRNLIPGRGTHRLAGHAYEGLGQTRKQTSGAARSTLRLGLSVRRGLRLTSCRCRLGAARGQRRYHVVPLRRDQQQDRAGSHAALIVADAGYHVAQTLVVPDNITLVRLPPYAPEFNPMENVGEYLRGNKLAITVVRDCDDIVDTASMGMELLRPISRPYRIHNKFMRRPTVDQGLALSTGLVQMSAMAMCGITELPLSSPTKRFDIIALFAPSRIT